MGATFSTVAKQSDGLYRPTSVCTPATSTAAKQCYSSASAAPTSIAPMFSKDYYMVNSPLKYTVLGVGYPTKDDNTSWFIPTDTTKADKSTFTGVDFSNLAYYGSLTADQVQQLNLPANQNPTVPSTYCAPLDPCPVGANCCATSAAVTSLSTSSSSSSEPLVALGASCCIIILVIIIVVLISRK